jgi:hypothetical protein
MACAKAGFRVRRVGCPRAGYVFVPGGEKGRKQERLEGEQGSRCEEIVALELPSPPTHVPSPSNEDACTESQRPHSTFCCCKSKIDQIV